MSRYAAAGVNVNIPSSNGRLFAALHSQAKSRANAQEQYLRDLQNRVVRDVRTAWRNAHTAFQRVSLTDQLLKQATDALHLAQARYKLGLSSIIEVSQGQLNLTQAELESAGARIAYETHLSILHYQVGALQ